MNKLFVLLLAGLAVLGVYLFVNAPPPLQVSKGEMYTLPVKQVLEILEDENDIAREIYTKEIVGAGKKVGLKFSEEWADDDVHAGPLPAQFLRQTSRSLESNPVPLGLFLGSDYAINKANSFEGEYLKMFSAVRRKRDSIYFYVEDAARYAYMAPDVAMVKGCVTCHNEHDETPKDDWKLNDVMGAATWTYPRAEVGYKETIDMLAALRKGFRDAYTAFLEEARSMSEPPMIGDKWPQQGRFLPKADVFMAEVERRSSANVLTKLMSGGNHSAVVVASN